MIFLLIAQLIMIALLENVFAQVVWLGTVRINLAKLSLVVVKLSMTKLSAQLSNLVQAGVLKQILVTLFQ